jgi:hypothetical protein
VVLEYEQGPDLNEDPSFRINSWGGAGIDAPHDLDVGEFIRMEPSIALHRGGDFGFSVDRVILDNSKASTPPEILEHFGTAEDFEGIYFRQMLIYYRNDQGAGFNFRVSDALISFAGEVSLEGALDIFLNKELTSLSVETRIFTGAVEQSFTHGHITPPASPPTVADPSTPPGRATVRQNSIVQVSISGGTPPYTVQVFRNTTDIWNSTTRQAVLDTVGENVPYLIYVQDSSGADPRKFAEYLSLTIQAEVNSLPAGGTGTASDRPSDPRRNPAILSSITGADAAHTIEFSDSGAGTVETISIPGTRAATVTITRDDGLPPITRDLGAGNRAVSFDLPHGSTYSIAVVYPTTGSTQDEKILHYQLDRPYTSNQLDSYQADVAAVSVDTSDPNNPAIQVPSGSLNSGDAGWMADIAGLTDWVRRRSEISGVVVDGFASKNAANQAHDQELSRNRKTVAEAVLTKLGISGPISGDGNNGHLNYDGPGVENGPGGEYRVARMRATFSGGASVSLTADISRAALPPVPTGDVPSTPAQPAPEAPPMPNSMPDVLRRLGIRIRLERNSLVVLELSGEIDFETAMEERLRSEMSSGGTTPADTDRLGLINAAGNDNPQDGVVDFKAIYSYNTATNEYGIILSLGSHPEDTDGLLHMVNQGGTGANRFKNIFGALLLFAPIINATAVSTADDSENAGNWIALGTSLAVPIAIGGLNIFRTRRVILFGGELIVKFSEPNPAAPQSADVGIVFDYGVEFDLVIESLGIGLDRNVPDPTAPPLKVRYRAIGFNLHYDSATGGMRYLPVFDSSKGYELELTDPSLFSLPDPLGNLFSITSARLARFNPLTLEIDLAIKFDLGVITVDRFKIKIPLEEGGNVMIMPSGVKVNIPATLIGSGFVNIVDTDIVQDDGTTVHAKGIEGGLDLTIVPVKLRIAGNVGVTTLRDPASGREGVGVFVGLTVEFPSPIVLGSSGLGLYGVMGLFAMHYRRIEQESIPPTDPVGPALKWLVKAEGDPTKLFNSSMQRLWGPNFDRWAFGIGVILGTVDTGFTANFQGMFILELPGPRILIMVKMKFISVRPAGVSSDYLQITTGILAVIDIDFDQEKITIGVLIDFEIEEILQIKIPIEILFKLDDPSHWHLWLGTFTVPASAHILNMVRGSAYFMIQGHNLTFPTSMSYIPPGSPILGMELQAVAIALGLEASLLFGSESVGLYLKIGAGFHVGLSFSPFVIVGAMFFQGKLRLFIVSIGADGHLDVLITKRAADPPYVYLHGEVCGHVSFFFFSISACIEITHETGVKHIEPPALINGVYLQSYAPVLVSGQGGDKPIDASLGNAVEGVATTDLPVVPIDTVLVMQLYASPLVPGTFDTFTQDITASPDLRPGGWIQLSKDTRVKYELESLSLVESTGSDYAPDKQAPATWRVERNSGESLTNGARTNVDLALFSRVPATADRAVERSTELERLVEVRWGNLCRRPAPPAPVLFTFCGQLLGPSASGWELNGIAKPDPPDTIRIQAPDTSMHVEDFHAPGATAWQQLVETLGLPYKVDARVVGLQAMPGEDLQGRKPVCIDLGRRRFRVADLLGLDAFIASGSACDDLRTNIFEEGRLSDDVAREDLLLERLGPAERLEGQPLVDLPGAETGQMEGYRGVVLEADQAIHYKKPVCKTDLFLVVFTPGRKIVLEAYSARQELLEQAVVVTSRRNVGLPIMASLEAEGISVVVVRAKGVEGLITRLCFSHECRKQPPRPAATPCHRALQLPYCNERREPLNDELLADDRELAQALDEYQKRREPQCFLDLATGTSESLQFFAAVRSRSLNLIRVQELDVHDNVLEEHLLADLAPQPVSNILTDLPGDWLDPALPWRSQIVPVSQFLFSGRFAGYDRFIFTLKPNHAEDCVTVRFVTNQAAHDRPSMYLGAVERLQLAELEHQGTIEVVQDGDQTTLEGYLTTSEGDRPLLKKNTIYHLTAEYATTVETKDTDGSTVTENSSHTQSFSFKTDGQAPKELKPYVLGTTPVMDEEYHFFRDPLKVVFNDRSTLQLYKAYGKDLVAVIRGADGDAVTNSPDTLVSLDPLPAVVETPYRDMVQALIDSGLLPCAGGIVPFNEHGSYEAPFELKPLMAYTFDIELVPGDTVAAGESKVALFRRSFRTSRYADLEDLADAVSTQPVYSVALTGPLTGLPAPGPSTGTSRSDIATATDVDIQNALTAAGLPPAPGQEQIGISILWVPSGTGFTPHAILIDAAEPLWRLRTEPEKKAVKDGTDRVIDPQFVIWEEGTSMGLELLEQSGTSIIDHFVRSTAGTRTLVMLDPSALSPSGDTPLTIDIRQPGSTFYGLATKRETLITIALEQKAPWQE